MSDTHDIRKRQIEELIESLRNARKLAEKLRDESDEYEKAILDPVVCELSENIVALKRLA